MTSYSVERPVRRPGRQSHIRPGLVHLRPSQVTTGQPVTIRTLDAAGNEIEFPAVYLRTDGMHLKCMGVDDNQVRRYRPSQVYPRRETYRRWTVTLKHRHATPNGDELYPLFVPARTELEARYEALKKIKARFGERASMAFTFHSARRDR